VELLKERNVLPSFTSTGTEAVVFAMSPDLYPVILRVANILRQSGQSVDVILEDKKPKWVFKHADKIGAKYCFIVGADEYAKGEVAVKNLGQGVQESVPIDSLASWMKQQQSQ
jgi:histidyl-tRNA synthetase